MEIETSRLRLRPLATVDTSGYAQLLADPRVHPFVVEGGPVSPEEIPDRIARKQKQWVDRSGATWAVLRGDHFVGFVALHELSEPRVAISYAIAPAEQAKGFGREAVAGVLGRVGDLGVDEVEARTHDDNEASVRLLRAVGFAEVEPASDPPRRVFQWLRRTAQRR